MNKETLVNVRVLGLYVWPNDGAWSNRMSVLAEITVYLDEHFGKDGWSWEGQTSEWVAVIPTGDEATVFALKYGIA